MSSKSPQEQFLPERKGGGIGPIVGIILIILLLALGGYYFFMQTKYGADKSLKQAEDPQTEALKQTSSSDEVVAIESDLEATDLGNIESDLSTIEAEF